MHSIVVDKYSSLHQRGNAPSQGFRRNSFYCVTVIINKTRRRVYNCWHSSQLAIRMSTDWACCIMISFSVFFPFLQRQREKTPCLGIVRERELVYWCVCVFVGLPWDDARVLSVFHRGGTNSPSEWCNQSNKASISAAGGIPVEYIWQQGASHTQTQVNC